ncbi:MAG: hypothetical protein Q4D29_02635 [Lachnospiraceae bacterium]|nr:hypothetical protein [Lachnospiraceae bacterium]
MANLDNYNLDKSKANDMLNNILDSCNIPPSSENIETIMMKKKLERKPLVILLHIAVLFLILVVLSPLAFKEDPNFTVIKTSKTVVVADHVLYDDCFVLTLSGAADYKNIHAAKYDGALIYPDVIDETTGLVIFPYKGDALNIYIPTNSGECIQAVLNENR